MKISKLTGALKDNGANIAKIVLGLAVAGVGLLGAVRSSDSDEPYEPGEIAESMSEQESESEEASEETSEE